jgi:SAM-dependent methyltransferase
MSDEEKLPFWERPEMVDRFAARDPDLRLVKLAAEYAHPGGVRVLDLGCAGGRNAVYLAQRGFDVVARDSSRAMVTETRKRLAEVLGAEEADRRVRTGAMDELSGIADGSIDLLVALGILHQARSETEWNTALREAHRVLAHGGRMLVANFTDEFDPDGTGFKEVEGEPHIRDRGERGRVHLVDAATLDREMREHGFEPLVPTETVYHPTDAGGVRVTANALYQKP